MLKFQYYDVTVDPNTYVYDLMNQRYLFEDKWEYMSMDVFTKAVEDGEYKVLNAS